MVWRKDLLERVEVRRDLETILLQRLRSRLCSDHWRFRNEPPCPADVFDVPEILEIARGFGAHW